MKTVNHYHDLTKIKNNDKLDYLKYRTGKIKHELWLKSRKSDSVYITSYDQCILDNLQTGKTGIFGSAGYYLEDCVEDLTVLEKDPIVKKFYPKAIIVKGREDIGRLYPKYFNNFIVTNNRSDMWCMVMWCVVCGCAGVCAVCGVCGVWCVWCVCGVYGVCGVCGVRCVVCEAKSQPSKHI